MWAARGSGASRRRRPGLSGAERPPDRSSPPRRETGLLARPDDTTRHARESLDAGCYSSTRIAHADPGASISARAHYSRTARDPPSAVSRECAVRRRQRPRSAGDRPDRARRLRTASALPNRPDVAPRLKAGPPSDILMSRGGGRKRPSGFPLMSRRAGGLRLEWSVQRTTGRGVAGMARVRSSSKLRLKTRRDLASATS